MFDDINIDDPFGKVEVSSVPVTNVTTPTTTSTTTTPVVDAAPATPTETEVSEAPKEIETQTSFNDVSKINEIEQPPTPKEIYTQTPSAPTEKIEKETNQSMFVTVSDPQVQSQSVGSYTDYLVEVRKTKNGSVVSSCRRRYNHFDWLYNSLFVENPSIFIPALPSTTLTQINGDKTQHRMHGLNIFCMRIAAHPILFQDPAFDLFLNGEPNSFTKPSVESKPTNPLKPSGKSKTNPNHELQEFQSKNTQFGDVWTSVDYNNVCIINSHYSLVSNYETLQDNFTKFAEIESSVAATVTPFASTLEKVKPELERFCDSYVEEFCSEMNELRRQVGSIERTILYKEDLQLCKENLQAQIEKKSNEKQATESGEQKISVGKLFGKTDDQIKREKLDALTSELQMLSFKESEASKLLEKDEATLSQEIAKWDTRRQKQCKQLFITQADKHIEHCKNNITMFTALLAEIESN